MVSTRDERADA
jgi:hypothetical protein